MKMKRLMIIVMLLMVFGVSNAIAANYAVVADGSKPFDSQVSILPGEQITFDIYLQGTTGANALAGGVWVDFSSSTDVISYISSSQAIPPWGLGEGVIVNEPDGPGTIMIIVAEFSSGASPDVDDDLIIGTVTLQCTSPGNAFINLSTIPAVTTWANPPDYVDDDINSNTVNPVLIVHQIGEFDDSDEDGIVDTEDNCPYHPNGPVLGTCTSGDREKIGVATCTSNAECGTNGFCSKNQEDIYPPGGNGIGDACECESDFNCDGDVDADDVKKFLEDFGRNQFNHPCPACAG